MGHRRACCYVPYTIHCGPQTQYEALICKTTKDSALCVLHSLAGRTEAPKEKVCVRIPAALPAPRVRFLFGEGGLNTTSPGGLTHELCYAYHAIGWGEEGAGTSQDKQDNEGGTS